MVSVYPALDAFLYNKPNEGPTNMVINVLQKVKFVQKLEISIWKESLKFGSEIRLARKFEIL